MKNMVLHFPFNIKHTLKSFNEFSTQNNVQNV